MSKKEERNYVIFPNKERCKESECAFFEEGEGENDRCMNENMAGTLRKVHFRHNTTRDDKRLCPCWGDESDRRDLEKEIERDETMRRDKEYIIKMIKRLGDVGERKAKDIYDWIDSYGYSFELHPSYLCRERIELAKERLEEDE